MSKFIPLIPMLHFLYSQATVEFNDFLINFDVICAGDSSTVMCLHSSAYADIGQWSHDVM